MRELSATPGGQSAVTEIQMLMYFNKEIQSLNANFVFKNCSVENIQISN